MGFVSFTIRLYTGRNVVSALTGTKPDLWPGRWGEVRFAAMGIHGAANDDSVIVWFCGKLVLSRESES